MHYALGALVFPLAYEVVFRKMVPGTMPGPLKGALWGLALWSVAETVVMPILDKAQIFHRRDVATSYLIGHLVYGLVFGALARK
jgi:uncharacterized membrane protein YagU involved in acid resistance